MKTPGKEMNTYDEIEDVVHQDYVFVLAILISIVVVYGQTLRFPFLMWDDPVYILKPPVSMGLTVASLKSAFTSQLMNHWHPLTMISHMLDVELFGMNSGAHHGMNVLIHTLNSLLLFTLLRSMKCTFWPSALATVLWALHPLHAENVAWLSDRKDLLCALFGLLALHAYVRFARYRQFRWYGLVLLCYFMGLLSKSMIITIPVMCLLLDVWPLQRFGCCVTRHTQSDHNGGEGVKWRRLLSVRGLFIEKIPLFVPALGFALFSYATTQRAGYLEYYGKVHIWGRLANSACSHMWYIAKTIWPSCLAGQYIHPDLPGGTPWKIWQIIGSVCLLVVISWAVWRLRRPYLLMGWLWFLVTLAPVNGIVQFGNPSRADRYVYVPMIGLLIMFTWGIGEIFQRCAAALRPPARNLIAGIAVGSLVLVLGTACWVQVGYWRNDEVFCERNVEIAPGNPYQNHNLALTYLRLGRYEEAMHHAKKAVAIWPMLVQTHELLATLYAREGNAELSSYHRARTSDLMATIRSEHRKWISQNVLAAKTSEFLTE